LEDGNKHARENLPFFIARPSEAAQTVTTTKLHSCRAQFTVMPGAYGEGDADPSTRAVAAHRLFTSGAIPSEHNFRRMRPAFAALVLSLVATPLISEDTKGIERFFARKAFFRFRV
jgi:hypothetical protein